MCVPGINSSSRVVLGSLPGRRLRRHHVLVRMLHSVMRIMCISGCAAGRFAHAGLSGRGANPLRGADCVRTRHDARSDGVVVSIVLTPVALPAARSAGLHECHHDSADDVPLVPPIAARSASPDASHCASPTHPAVCESPLQAQCPSDKHRCLTAARRTKCRATPTHRGGENLRGIRSPGGKSRTQKG